MIVHIVGARPQFIKLMPLWHALDALGAPQSALHSGQHYESSMSAVFFEEFGIAPDGVLQWCSVHEDNIAAMSKTLEKWSPSTVVVYGDTFTTWCGARAAKRLGLPLAHVEAGLRSFNAEMPEEEARIKTDTISDWHFVPSESALMQLRREGLDRGPNHTLMTGDIMADAMMHRKSKASQANRILVTVHRNTNVDEPAVRQRIVTALAELAGEYDIHWPIHPRLRAHFAEGELPNSIHWYPPLGRKAMLEQLDAADWVITDSGGVQKEAYFCQRKSIVLRGETEWVELLSSGQSFLVHPAQYPDAEALSQALLEVLERATPKAFPPIYGNGDAATKMAAALWKKGPCLPNELVLRGDAHNPQLAFAAEVTRRVTGIKLTFTPGGAVWPRCAQWNKDFRAWNVQEIEGDFLAKAAYLASRAEEFQEQAMDMHGRAKPEDSMQWVALQQDPDIPQGHVWLEAFIARFVPDYSLSHRSTAPPTVVVDMDHLYAFKGYSWLHRGYSALRNLFKGQLKVGSLHFAKQDPFDASATFEKMMASHPSIRWQFFAWIGPQRGPYDKGPTVKNIHVAQAINLWARKSPSMGLHPTYAHHAQGFHGLRLELEAFTKATGKASQRLRYHYLKMKLPASQKALYATGVKEDWSMEYAKVMGYRAGVAVPIPAWGVGDHGATDQEGIPYLTYVPVALMDQNLLGMDQATIAKTLQDWSDRANRFGAGLVLATHWRFFSPGMDVFPETRQYRPWVHGLQTFLGQWKR